MKRSASNGLSRAAILFILMLAGIGSSPGRADEPDVDFAQTAAAPISLRSEDLRVARVAYRIAVAGAPLCPSAYPVTGLIFHHLPEYDEAGRRIQIERYRLDLGPGVLGTVPESPAAKAGLLAGDVLLSVNGVRFADPRAMAAEKVRDRWREQVKSTEAQLEAALRAGTARLRVLRAGRELDLTLQSISACPARVRLAWSSQANAFANDGYVIITTRMLGMTRNDDELAILIGHELAHNVLDHEARLQAQDVPRGLLRGFGRNAKRVRVAEEEADRLGLRFARMAGYDLIAGAKIWRRFPGAELDGLQLFRTHPSLAARERMAREEMTADLQPSAAPN